MTSKFLRHIPCDHCGSSDAAALYDDGHTHCFNCGTTEHEGAYDERTVMRDAVAPRKVTQMEIKGTWVQVNDLIHDNTWESIDDQIKAQWADVIEQQRVYDEHY